MRERKNNGAIPDSSSSEGEDSSSEEDSDSQQDTPSNRAKSASAPAQSGDNQSGYGMDTNHINPSSSTNISNKRSLSEDTESSTLPAKRLKLQDSSDITSNTEALDKEESYKKEESTKPGDGSGNNTSGGFGSNSNPSGGSSLGGGSGGSGGSSLGGSGGDSSVGGSSAKEIIIEQFRLFIFYLGGSIDTACEL